MKLIRLFVFLLLCLMLLTACGGDTGNVERVMSQSALYSEEEIGQAMDMVEAKFRKEFEGCRLKNLRYHEYERYLLEQQEWAAQYGEEEAIVLLSDFSVSEFGADPSLNPNENYINWKWVLTRSDGGKWTLRTWGYG